MFASRIIIATFTLCLSVVASHNTSGSADRAFAIRNTISKYAIDLANKDWDALGEVFADDIVANYTGQTGKVLLTGVPAIQQFLITKYVQHIKSEYVYAHCHSIGKAGLNNQHAITTQYIEETKDGAKAITFFEATFFGAGNGTGVVSSWGKYTDELAPQADGKWKIVSRDEEFMVRLRQRTVRHWRQIC
jgi:ketosteroid isomerase-like protein